MDIQTCEILEGEFPKKQKKLVLAWAELHQEELMANWFCSMENLPFGDREYDIIWSEGAIYNIGFERGVIDWNRYLKVG